MIKLTKDKLLRQLAQILTYSEKDMRISIKEIDTFSYKKTQMYMSSAKYTGYNPIVEATKIIIRDLEQGNVNLSTAFSIIIHYKVSANLEIGTILDGMRLLKSEIALDADVYMGISYDSHIKNNDVVATVVV